VTRAEPIAIVGLSCRLPQAPDRAALWRLLRDEVDAITAFPAGRLAGWDGDPAALAPGGFIDRPDMFDAELFGVSPREAAAMDPQQRLALELAWEGFEDACLDPGRWRDRPAGVFIGMMYGDYADVLTAAGEEGGRHTLTGLVRGVAANRISHFFGLQGPSLVVDSGQSSSLVATHLACESLRSGESELALAGGVNLILSPLSSLRARAIGALSPDGRAYVFDARANGFVRGEGGAIAVLRRLSDAVADGDRIHAVIAGSAVNSGTGAAGITAPSAAAQQQVMRAALARAGLEPATVGYVELHGTGTQAGDPVEAAALGAVYGAGRAAGERLAVGSVKTNIGHLEGAAGSAGLLKAALCVQRRELVASLNFERPNPQIALDELGLRVVQRREPWPDGAGGSAGVSSFGVGGTNCHLLLSAAPVPARAPGRGRRGAGAAAPPQRAGDAAAPDRAGATPPPAGVVPWVLSAHGEAALRAQAQRLHEHVMAHPALEPADVGWTLATGRAHLARRAVVVGADRATLLARTAAVAAGEPADGVALGAPRVPGEIAFVFPGQGSQWPLMAIELWERAPAFARSIEACAEALAPFVDWSLEDVLRDVPGAPPLEQVDVVQPVMFAMAVSLAALWRSYGVQPAFVVGHSQGEVAAAHVAGALSLQDAARVAALRGRTAMALAGRGGMLSVLLHADAVRERIARFGERLTIGVFNGPGSVAVSGELEPLGELLAELEADGVRARRIVGAYASHSPQAELIRERLLEELAPIVARTGEIAFCSAVTGDVIDGTGLGADYWFSNLRQPVSFEQATRALVARGTTAFLEMSPHPVLTVAVESTISSIPDAPGEIAVVSSLRRDEGGLQRFATSVGEAHARGVAVDWAASFDGDARRRVDLPTYAFQRRRHWVGEEPTEAAPALAAGGPSDDMDAAALLELVLAQAASVLGHGAPDAISPRRAFRELGFDSLAGVELRNRLAQVTGLRLPATLVFDHPTPTAVAQLLGTLLEGGEQGSRAIVRARVNDDEPIAIVGIGCRYPGGVRSAQDLWELVAAGTDAIGPFPQDRGWDLDAIYDPDPDHVGTSYTRAGGFLQSAGDFDAAFFQISPAEALAMDPQQRILLETAWETLEDAGIDPSSLHGSPTGVFAGVSSQDYGTIAPGDAGELEGLRLTGTLTSVVSGRLAYALGLQGPALTVDTACSSSLVALHLACQSLRDGECSLALAGGVTVLGTPGVFVEFSRQRGLAADGRCKAFAAGADGTGWGEGAGLLLVERLSDARRHGRRVLGLVRGTAINQDGASNGLSAPNAASQEQVIRQALANAGVAPGEVDAVEAHGTGTMLGDPIEAGALIATYGREREGTPPLRLGSVKSNLGHTQAAAGVAGVIKMIMAMRAGVLPATLHVDAPSPHVDWSAGTVELATSAVEWPRGQRPRRAGVSSFGISGTNAHVVLEEGPAEAPRYADPAQDPRAVPWILSAKSDAALRAQAQRLRAHMAEHPQIAPIDCAWSLVNDRARLEHRAVLAGEHRDELLAGLDAVARGAPADRVVVGRARAPGRVAFVFPGQGSQWAGMALDLWASAPAFAQRMEDCAAALEPFVGWCLQDVLRGAPGAPALERMDVVQPALFAVMVSLAGLWRSYGVEPSVVVGHSQGEIAAAHVAGALSLHDAARVTALRSRALVEIAGAGGMMSVALGAEDVCERIAAWDGRLSLASYNGPRSSVVSGDPGALDELLAACEADGVRASRIAVDYASHSSHVDAIRERLLDDLAPIRPVAGTIAILSTTTGTLIDGAEMGAEHWYRNLREPVRFAQATRALLHDGVTAFVETSPHPVLSWALRETIDDGAADPDAIAIVGSLRRQEGTLSRFLTSLGEAYVHGVAVDWQVAFAGRLARRVALPTYAFQRKRFWLERRAPGTGDVSAAGLQSARHPLLGGALALAGEDAWLLTGRLSRTTHPWLADHVVRGETLLAGPAFTELALRAGAEAGCDTIEDLTLTAPLILGNVALQVKVGPPDERGRRPIDVHARPDDGDWVRHASGTLSPAAPAPHVRLEDWPPTGAEALDVDDLYDALAGQGFTPGPAFAIVRAAWRRGGELFAEVALGEPEAADAARFAVHPALLEAALQTVVARQAGAQPRLAFEWTGVHVQRPGASALRVRIAPTGGDALRITATDERGRPAVSVDGLVTRPIAAAVARDELYVVRWIAAPVGVSEAPAPRVITLGDVKLPGASRFDDLAALRGALAAGAPADDTVVVAAPSDVRAALALLQGWLSDERLRDVRLVVLTHGALSVAGEAPEPGLAAIVGLVRSARSEQPGRFVSIDVATGGGGDLAAALATGEPEVALRDGAILVPRLTGIDTVAPTTARRELDRGGTVLVTGGTGGLGAVVAEHLAREHGVRHLLLVSRRGPAAPGAGELRARLEVLGCSTTLAACDVSDRSALADLLAAIDPQRPLTAVVHMAGTFANGLVESLDEEALEVVMRPKSDAARWLDELTAGLDLAAFVLFSSVAATFGHPGQGNYAAANAQLDALAQRRQALGLPATSIAWGIWEQAGGMVGRLSRLDVEQAEEGTGQRALATAQALELLDAALERVEPSLVAASLDLGALRAQARAGLLPALLSELVPAAPRRAARPGGSRGSLTVALAAAAPGDRDELVLELVRAQAAAALGHVSVDEVGPERPFKELGFDSLGAVMLRNRLAQVTGLRLPSTLVFDQPTPRAMATFLRLRAEDAEQEEQTEASAPSTNGRAAQPSSAPRSPAPPRQTAAAGRRYGGPVLSSLAGAVRTARFGAWVLHTRARLARLGCRLVVETDGTPRFDDLPHVAIDSIGDGRGSLTLRIGRDCRFGRELTLDLWTHTDGVVEIGDRCHLQNRIRLQPWGGAIRLGERVQVRDGAEVKSKGELVVGRESIIGRNVTIHCHERIELADRVGLAEGVTIMDSDRTHDGSDTHVARQPVVSSPVRVESNVFVGTNALILRGSHVGANAMIATGAVLTGGDYPERHLLAGVPAQPLRPLAPDEPTPA